MGKINQRNYYRILYVQPDAPFEIIQASYRTLMQKLKAHPDLGGDEWIASVINEAYDVLSDSTKRRAYDEVLFAKYDWKTLGMQSPRQRDSEYSLDATWQDFKPIRL